MSRRQIVQAIRETTFATTGSRSGPRDQRGLGRSGDAGAIGSTLRSLHDRTASESLPADFEALLLALEAADRRELA